MIRSIALAICIIFSGCSASQDPAPNRSDSPNVENETLSVTRFNECEIVGHLGQPLGKIVRVTGNVVDGSATGIKAGAGKTMLEFETVNGETLDEPVLLQFPGISDAISEPNPGESFDYYVHEYGEFSGVVEPDESHGVEYEPIAHDGFYFRPKIVIHKSIK